MRNGHQIADDLRSAVDEGVRLLDGVPEALTAQRPAAGDWCAREVIGHLIDSACNNHRRFIINQTRETLAVDPYDQNEWTARQRYAERSAADLVMLWAAYNRHLATVIEAIADDVLQRPRGPAAGLGFAYAAIEGSSASIGLLAEDYVGHLRHHLGQLRNLVAAA
jgi:hypothetical protein